MTDSNFTKAVDAVQKLSPYRSRRKCEELVRTVIEMAPQLRLERISPSYEDGASPKCFKGTMWRMAEGTIPKPLEARRA
jgi:hypothetical protein